MLFCHAQEKEALKAAGGLPSVVCRIMLRTFFFLFLAAFEFSFSRLFSPPYIHVAALVCTNNSQAVTAVAPAAAAAAPAAKAAGAAAAAGPTAVARAAPLAPAAEAAKGGFTDKIYKKSAAPAPSAQNADSVRAGPPEVDKIGVRCARQAQENGLCFVALQKS